MLVYHGTTATVAREAVTKGLHPRGDQGTTNWPSLPSNLNMVYMTKSWSLAYAAKAVENAANSDSLAAIIEIDTEKLVKENLRPDEDFLKDYRQLLDQFTRYRSQWEQGLLRIWEKFPEIRPIEGETFAAFSEDVEVMQAHWQRSLELLGTVAYKGIIPPTVIVRYAIIDTKNTHSLIKYSRMLSVRIMNYLMGRDQQAALIKLIFDRQSLPYQNPKGGLSSAEIEKYNNKIWGTIKLKLATEKERLAAVQVVEGPFQSCAVVAEVNTEGDKALQSDPAIEEINISDEDVVE